jgi:hypothetical protein
MASSAIALAFRPLGADGIPEIFDQRVRLRAGLFGIGFGVGILVAGWLIGWGALSWVISLFMGDKFSGTVHVPKFVNVVLFGFALWGGLMVVVGCARTIQAIAPNHGGFISMIVVPPLTICILLMLIWSLQTAGILGG